MAENVEITAEELAKRKVRCLIAYLSPFSVISSKGVPLWETTIEQVNRMSWDYVALHDKVTGVDVGLPRPFHMLIGRDGALALPPMKQHSTVELAADFFNRCLAAILIGGIYCEAITSDCIDLGFVLDWKYIRTEVAGVAAANQFHERMKRRQAAPLEAIRLLNPRRIEVEELAKAIKVGLDVLERAHPVRADFLLKGVTAFARRDWTTALANLWIVIEQLLSSLWERFVVTPTLALDSSKGRKDQLKDSRTWTSSARIELFYQKGIISLDTLGMLSKARKARNDLSHHGEPASLETATAAYEASKQLLGKVLDDEDIPLFRMDLANHAVSDPFRPVIAKVSPTHWMEIQFLPGEKELSQAEFRLLRERRNQRRPDTKESPEGPGEPSTS